MIVRLVQQPNIWLMSSANAQITETNRRLLKSEVGARAILDLVEWYERQWADSREFKDELIDLLDTSKFGEYPYTPYEIYLKAIYTYFKDELEGSETSRRALGRGAL